MPPKRKAALKSKKAEQIAIEDDMSRITVRRPLKNNDNGNLKDEEQDVRPLQEDVSEFNTNMEAMVVIEKMPDIYGDKQELVETDEDVDSNKKSGLKKNVLSKVTKPESKKKLEDDGKVSKKIRKRAVSEDKQTNEEKVVSSRNKKRQIDKDLLEPSHSNLNEPLKRSRRAASVDVLTKNSSSVVSEPKRVRKVKKGPTVETTEDLVKIQRRSSSKDSLILNISPEAVPKKIRKATKAVVETADKSKKNPKVIKTKEPKILGKNKKEEKTTNKEVMDEKENIDLLPMEQNNIAEEIEDKLKSTTALTKEQINEELEIKDDIPEKAPKQINSKSRGKRQVAQKVISKSKQDKSSEESNGKTDSDDSDVLIITPEQPTEGQDLELKEDSPKETPKQTKSKIRGKRQVAQKQLSKINKSSEESSGKSNTDDSDMAKSPNIKPKRIGKQKETNIDHGIKLLKRQTRKARNVKFEKKQEQEDILGSDENVKNGPLSDTSDTPESEKNSAPTIVKRRAKAKPTKKK